MRIASRGRADVAIVTSALLVGALGLGTALGTSAGASVRVKANTITISNFEFHKMVLRVNPGALIKVTNRDSVLHTLTSTDHRFNTGDIGHNRTKVFRAPLKAGIYGYICGIHQFMTGSIIVK